MRFNNSFVAQRATAERRTANDGDDEDDVESLIFHIEVRDVQQKKTRLNMCVCVVDTFICVRLTQRRQRPTATVGSRIYVTAFRFVRARHLTLKPYCPCYICAVSAVAKRGGKYARFERPQQACVESLSSARVLRGHR